MIMCVVLFCLCECCLFPLSPLILHDVNEPESDGLRLVFVYLLHWHNQCSQHQSRVHLLSQAAGHTMCACVVLK